MACEPLPDHPRALEILLEQTAQFLNAMDPILSKCLMQDVVLRKLVEDPQSINLQTAARLRLIQDELNRAIPGANGLPISTLRKYLDTAANPLFGKDPRKLCPNPESSSSLEVQVQNVARKHEIIKKWVAPIRRLQAKIIDKLDKISRDHPTPGPPESHHETPGIHLERESGQGPSEASTPASSTQGPILEVWVTKTNDRWMLSNKCRESVRISKKCYEFFGLFVVQIVLGHAHEVVRWRSLNEASAGGRREDDTAKATPATRTKLTALNKLLKRLGQPPDQKPWIVTERGLGAGLNETVRWIPDEDCQRTFRESVYDLPTDPGVMAENTPNRGERLPARSSRIPPVRVENEEEDD